MINILQCLTGHPAYDSIRITEPLSHVKNDLWDYGINVQTKLINECSPQIFLSQDHCVFSGAPSVNMINVLRHSPCPFSFMVDDLHLDVPEWNPNHISNAQRQVLEWCYDNAAYLICTTYELAKKLGRYKARTMMAGNYMDFTPLPTTGNDVLYAGGNSHTGDLDLLNDLDTDRNVVVWSSTLPEKWIRAYRDKHGTLKMKPHRPNYGWINCTNDYELYNIYKKNLAKDFKYGLAPLVDCEFNKCKSTLKALEYMAMGLIPVVSDVEPYSWLPNYACIKVKDNNWAEALEQKINYEDALYFYRQHYSWQIGEPIWREVYEELASV